eukprot:1330589-Amorphochlora_amoeboformis.AAC.2
MAAKQHRNPAAKLTEIQVPGVPALSLRRMGLRRSTPDERAVGGLGRACGLDPCNRSPSSGGNRIRLAPSSRHRPPQDARARHAVNEVRDIPIRHECIVVTRPAVLREV